MSAGRIISDRMWIANMVREFRKVANKENELKIVYEDRDILVCEKPARVPSQSDRSMDYDMVSRVKNYLAGKGEDDYVAIINRLDRPVRGLTLFAKNKKAAAVLSKKMQEHDFGKFYKAIVEVDDSKISRERLEEIIEQSAKGEEITLTDYLAKDGRTNVSKVVKEGTKGAKKACLAFSLEKTEDNNTHDLFLARIELFTGRHHQIRVQMANAGLPLVGDTKYGMRIPKERDGKREFVDVLLCAYKLVIEHPVTGKKLTFEIE